MKKTKHFAHCLLPILFVGLPLLEAPAQSLSSFVLLKEITLPAAPVAMSLSQYSQLFVADHKGNLYGYDTEGTEQLRYSSGKTAFVSSLDAGFAVRVFVFYQDFQQVLFLDRFLQEIIKYPLQNEQIFFVSAASPAGDQTLWLLDDGDLSLKKYDMNQKRVITQTYLDLVLETPVRNVVLLKEYQNQLILYDHQAGILIFDNLGNHRRTIERTNLKSFSFHEEFAYFLEEGQLKQLHLYTFEEQASDLPGDLKTSPDFVLLSSTRLWICVGQKLYLYARP